ncbi:hypothetical protein BGX29_011553, partial [Mortierella sp. GBA35]
KLVVYIAKQPFVEVSWDGLVFEQISRLRQLRALDLQRNSFISYCFDEPRYFETRGLRTLDLRLPVG